MKLSLQAKLIAAALLVTIIVAAVLTFLAVSQQISSNKNNLSSEVNAQSHAFTRYLSSWANDRSSAMSAMRSAIESHYVANGNKLDHSEALKILNQGKDSVGFGMSFIGLEDGTMYRHNPELDKNKPDYDPRVRGWYKGAKKVKEPFISKPYIAVTGKKLAITFVEPVIIDGKYLGAIGGLVYLEEILTDVLDLTVRGEGYGILLDKSGVITAHNNKELILKETAELGAEFAIDRFNKAANYGRLLDISATGEDTLIYANEVVGTNWIFLLAMHKSVLNEPVNELLFKVLLGVGILLVLAAVGVTLLIRWLFADLKQVSTGLDNIARGNGDLTLRINTNSRDEIGMLADSFNRFVSSLHGIISNMHDVGSDLGVQAEQAASTARVSADNVKIQKEEMSLVASAVTDMSEATKDIAQSANSASGVADVAVSISSQGQEQVRKSQASINALAGEVSEASDVIQKLDEHVQEIGSILTTISGIAEQTNLLALNAAIEAARAGEQGRGFAVVADEVRVLSQRTHSSTEEIQNMINVLQETTQNAVKSMKSSQTLADTSVGDAEIASESLEKIRMEISRINDMVTHIASEAEQQTSLATEVNKNANTIHAANQKLSTDVDESLVRANSLNGLTEKLKSDLQQFKL